jgi:hypothetical protein
VLTSSSKERKRRARSSLSQPHLLHNSKIYHLAKIKEISDRNKVQRKGFLKIYFSPLRNLVRWVNKETAELGVLIQKYNSRKMTIVMFMVYYFQVGASIAMKSNKNSKEFLDRNKIRIWIGLHSPSEKWVLMISNLNYKVLWETQLIIKMMVI